MLPGRPRQGCKESTKVKWSVSPNLGPTYSMKTRTHVAQHVADVIRNSPHGRFQLFQSSRIRQLHLLLENTNIEEKETLHFQDECTSLVSE